MSDAAELIEFRKDEEGGFRVEDDDEEDAAREDESEEVEACDEDGGCRCMLFIAWLLGFLFNIGP